MEIGDLVGRYAVKLEQAMAEALSQIERPDADRELRPLYDILKYQMGWIDERQKPTGSTGGKRIRPTLCFLACEAVGGEAGRALHAAAAIELVHNFTLIHDDVQDRSDERRHRPAIWKLWGNAQAINTGDALFALASLELFRLVEDGVAAGTALECARILNQTLVRLCEGQFLDVSFEARLDVTAGLYLAMIERKTAALLGCATELGALLGAGDPVVAERYREFGYGLGVAFQIQDDILGIWGEASETGKPNCDDIFKKKKTLPLILGLDKATSVQRERLLKAYRSEIVSAEDALEVKTLLTSLGAREDAEAVARKWSLEALQCLDDARPEEESGDAMRLLASSLLGRKS